MTNVVPFPGGDGPDDTILAQRVARLEDDMKDQKTLLKQQQQSLTEIQVKLGAIDGRLVGLDAKISALPTTWTLLSIVFTTWALGSGILIFAMNFVRP